MYYVVRVAAPYMNDLCSNWYLDRGWKTRESAQKYCDKMNGGSVRYDVVDSSN